LRRPFKILSGSAETPSGVKVGFVSLKENEEVGEHSTENCEELIIVLEGEGYLLSKGESLPLRKAQVCYIPPFTQHNVRAKTGLSYVYVVIPRHVAH